MSKSPILLPLTGFVAILFFVMWAALMFVHFGTGPIGEVETPSAKFTVHLGAGFNNRTTTIDTDKLIFTQAGDWLIQDKRTEKWTFIKGDARVIVNDPTALKLIYARHQQEHKILHQKRNKI